MVPLKFPHSQTSVSRHSRMQIGVLHSTGKELIDALFGQTGNGQIEFFLPTELHRVTAGKSLLLQHRTQVIQNFSIALLRGVPGGDADGSKHIIGRCGEMLRLTPLDVLWQFAAASCFQLLHHIRAKLGNQIKVVFGYNRIIAGPIHRITDRHIASKAQQILVHILRPQLRPCGTERERRKVVLILSNLKKPLLHLVFDVFSQGVANLPPAHQPPQGIAECNSFLIGESLQRQFGQIPLQELAGKKGRSALVPNDHRIAGMVFFCSSIQHILDALIGVFQHFGVRIWFLDQIITTLYAVAFRQTHSRPPLPSRFSVIGIKICR